MSVHVVSFGKHDFNGERYGNGCCVAHVRLLEQPATAETTPIAQAETTASQSATFAMSGEDASQTWLAYHEAVLLANLAATTKIMQLKGLPTVTHKLALSTTSVWLN